MAWTAPVTPGAGNALTNAFWTTHVKNNLLETAVAKVTTAGDQVYATGANALARIAQGAITGGAGNPKHVLKAADETVASSVALQNDNELLLPMLANEVWIAEFFLILSCSSATPDFRFGYTVPALAAGNGWSAGQDSGAATFAFGQDPLDGTTSNIVAVGATGFTFLPTKVYVANGANAGNLQLQWAQGVSNAALMKVNKGSFLRAYKVA